jgi:hypothetical protein
MFLIGMTVLVLAAGTGGVFLASRGDEGAETTTKGLDLGRANPTCSTLGERGNLDGCVGLTPNDGQANSASERRTVDELEVGDCVNDLRYPDADVVPCAAAHQQEVVAVLDGPEGGFPGSELLVDTFTPQCDTRGADYVGKDPASEELYVQPEIPSSAAEWGVHGRRIICSVSSIRKELRQGSVRG